MQFSGWHALSIAGMASLSFWGYACGRGFGGRFQVQLDGTFEVGTVSQWQTQSGVQPGVEYLVVVHGSQSHE